MKEHYTSKMMRFSHPDKFGEWLGYEILSFDRKKCYSRTRLEIREDHLSPSRRVHGGVISAFCDFTCGAAVFTTLGGKDFCATVEMKVNYLQPVVLGDVLTSKAEVVFRGRKICVIHALLYKNRERKPTAMASATFKVVPSVSLKEKLR